MPGVSLVHSVVTGQNFMHDIDEQLREIIPRLRRFAVSLTRNPSSADDLVQSCLCLLYTSDAADE